MLDIATRDLGGVDPAELAVADSRVRSTLRLGPLLDVTRARGGQSNPTLFLDYGTVQLVLRSQPPGTHAAGAHDLSREYRFLTALAATRVPVPEPIDFIESGDGRQLYVMRRLNGRVHDEARLPGCDRETKIRLYRAHAETLAALHTLDVDDVGLGDLHRPGQFLQRQQRRWVTSFGHHREADVDHLNRWLTSRQPSSAERRIVHGDLKFNNLVVDEHAGRVVGILDWELATVGDPTLDLAHVWCSTWATRPDEYGGLPDSLAERRLLGVPEFEEYESWYWHARGGELAPLTTYHKALALLRYAGIFYGIGLRASAGTAASDTAERDSRLADVFLDRALAIAGVSSYRSAR